MNERERFRCAMSFGVPDKVPFEPGGPRESTLAVWHQQGLPEGISWQDELERLLGIEIYSKEPHLALDVNFAMLPIFEEKVLEHRNGHYIVQDWMGAVTEISDQYDYTYIRTAKDFVTRQWHSFPVQSRKDWEEKIRWRFDAESPQRFPQDFDERCKKLKNRSYELRLNVNGPFWQLREWCGFENLCVLMHDDPALVQDMVDFWSIFVQKMLDKILEKVDLDFFQISEDMAYKAHSMISPRMARRFLMPTWEAWTSRLRNAGCPVLSVDSDGYIGELIPLWIETGFNCTWPVEVAAGNDLVAFRQQYKKKMAYGGGIDKRALARGGEVMRDELQRVIPPLLVDGGYVPGCDHGVPPDIAWPDFVNYTRLLAQLTGWM